ncbi:LysR family transcriptional regulator substrate-binding protein [Deinococcus malanensis]|uniref:LysR family transcriptional regulator substrate-binding protein n=1 Tax=Deinococcus malanensis TaxID=1706855 RepID=UPI0036316013
MSVSLIDSESESCGGGTRAVLSGHSDAAVVVEDESTELHLTPLAQDEYLFVAPASRGTHGVTLSELSTQALYLPPERDSCHLRVLRYLASQGVSTAGVFPITQDSVTLGLVSHGLGVTVMPRLALLPLPPGLVALPLPQPLMRPLALGVLPHRAGLPIIRAFTATLVASLRSRAITRPELPAQPLSGPLLH